MVAQTEIHKYFDLDDQYSINGRTLPQTVRLREFEDQTAALKGSKHEIAVPAEMGYQPLSWF
jgi:hypothetical protein